MSFLDKILDGEVDEKAVSDMQQSLQQSLQTDMFTGPPGGSRPGGAPSHVPSHGPVSTVQSYIPQPSQPVISRSNFSMMPASIKTEPVSSYHTLPSSSVAPIPIKTEPPGVTRQGPMMTMLQPVHPNQPTGRSIANAPVQLSTQTMLTQVQAARSSPHTVTSLNNAVGGSISSSAIVPTAVITPQRSNMGPQVIAVSSSGVGSVMLPMAGGQFAVQAVSSSQPPQTINAQVGGVRPNMIPQPIRAMPNKPMVVPIQPLVQMPPNTQVKSQPIPIQPAVRHPQPIQPPKSEQKTAAILSSMSTRESVQKLKAFLTNLLSISNKQDAATGQTVKDLIGKVMTNNIDEEMFLNELQVALKSPPQPHLLVFLKQSVPVLRTEMQSRQRMTLMSKQAPQQQPQQPQPPVASHTPFPGLAPVQTSKMIPLAANNQNMNQPHFSTSTHYHPAPTFSAPQRTFADKYKKKYTLPKDNTEIIDVASMAGVNLTEEAAKISTGSSNVSQEHRSTQDVTLIPTESLSVKINRICEKQGLRDCAAETKQLLSHAVEARLKNLMERLVVINHHRLDLSKDEDEVITTSNVKGQLKILEKIQLEESKRRAEREKAQLMKEAKSRSKQSNSEAKAKAKQVAMAEEELIRQREANQTALAAIGRKRPKFDYSEHGALSATSNPRLRSHRINMKDIIFLCENDHHLMKSPLLFKLHVNPVK